MATYFEFFREPQYNHTTRDQLWVSAFTDSHDSYCGCTKPITHLLSIIFPPGHADRHLTIHQILKREEQDSKCLFGGLEETGGGEAEEDPTTKEDTKDLKREDPEEGFTDIKIEDLIAAAKEGEEG